MLKSLNTTKIREAFEANGFVWAEAIRDIGTDHYYAAPSDGIYRLDKESVEELNRRTIDIFTAFNNGRVVDDIFIVSPERQIDYVKSLDEKLTLRLGSIEKWVIYEENYDFSFPTIEHSTLGKVTIAELVRNPPAKDEEFQISVYPSPEFVRLYLGCLYKVKEISRVSRQREFHYKSIRTGEDITVTLSPKSEGEQTFTPLVEALEPRIEINGRKVFMAPPRERQAILEAISGDIKAFGGIYNWTTDWNGNRIWVNKYNEFFKGRLLV